MTYFEPGIKKIEAGTCPLNAVSAMACMFCSFGHMTECHHPKNCQQANCSHYIQDNEITAIDFNEDEDEL